METKAALRLLASGHDEAGKALREIAKILGPHFVKHEIDELQGVIWRTGTFKAGLILDTADESLSLSFRDKGNTAGFDAEGKTAQELFADIRYNVGHFKPTKAVPPDIQAIRDKFEVIK